VPGLVGKPARAMMTVLTVSARGRGPLPARRTLHSGIASGRMPQRGTYWETGFSIHCAAEGTSWQEMGPDFFQPSRRSQVLGWYTKSGS
jgi:hypothetical protein